ncbi:MAG TPA: DUF983 domain-containing protein [Gemmatimonadales bacterium]|nr:DUF983 domain-containing protein [Gemmatimonadales bacterium]
MTAPRPRLPVVLARAVARRCPACGARGLFDGWFRIRESCPRCGILTDRREPDYFLGAVLVNFIVAESLAVGVAVLVVLATWPMPRWGLTFAGGLACAVLAPIVCYPISKTLWLGVDLLVRPPVYAWDTAVSDA